MALRIIEWLTKLELYGTKNESQYMTKFELYGTKKLLYCALHIQMLCFVQDLVLKYFAEISLKYVGEVSPKYWRSQSFLWVLAGM